MRPTQKPFGRRAFALMVGIVAVLGLSSAAPARPLKVETLDIVTARGVFHFKVEVADTFAARETGLMNRKSLATDRGMLFDFKSAQYVGFWMKNTLIPLDMLFISRDGKIASIAQNAVPMSEAAIPSGAPVLAVLELAGGRAAQIGALPGDHVRERIFKP